MLSTLALAASLACAPMFAGAAPAASAAPEAANASAAPAADRQAFIDGLIGRMTLDEKIGQLRLISIGPEMPAPKLMEEITAGRVGGTFNSVTRKDNRPLQEAAMRSRMKIPMFFAYDVVHGHRTVFPISLGLASSWDMGVVEKAARISGLEAAADSLDATFAPMVDISRDPRWGRTSEGFGEDPFLVSQCARASVKGFQGSSPANPDSVMAFVKHFALYGAVEGGRDYNTVDMSPQRMYNDYLPPYRAGLDAGAGGVMIALNSVNGQPATSNKWLLRDLLRKEWGFKGVTVSDHGAIDELLRHGVASTGRDAARLAIEAGVDMSMADTRYLEQLPTLVKSGAVPVSLIDEAVREVLNAKYDMGLFQDPFRRIGRAADDPPDVNAESRLHRAEAREAARKSMVLLENRNRTLPLKKGGTVAVIGPLADAQIDMMGSWSAAGVARQAVTLLQGMRDALAGKGQVTYARGANITDDQRVVGYLNFLNWDNPEVVQDKRSSGDMIEEAVRVARGADTVVVAVGETRGMSHEASSRSSLGLPGTQLELLKALKTTGKPLVLVLMNGRPLTINWEKDNADAILEAWYPGTEGGHAIADLLFGDANPSGKLPVTFPRSLGQIPTYYNALRIGRPFTPGKAPNYTSQYFEEDYGPLYPFGYGLSYTTFSLSDVRLSGAKLARNGNLTASVTVKNTGDRAGEAVLQLYLQDVMASTVRPAKELKDFRKVMLAPGESRVIDFPIGEDKLRFYNAKLEYVAEPGEFNVQVGLDSATVKEARFTLE
ncbi:beta-glucosidase BglX [Cupriavidus sp.]|uniref:beta-glucosidase BglX n=1 Tax=Cupriavidus sp. TaxID=1873897 RepID=UPI0025BCC7F4|nr:beta-glucosidase BglX [Cupriavidus sp.]MCA3184494.1 beta-glucosidase BglX [Cupriavidus sp.]MCA3188821.1 beta-glucosidase BglX [Cupriavidus sp.]MCA3198541.1 beta-glucosidase BglX [Cupriavidus sp.]MCA3201287.1 beta-glucosidase BglX [Cupriavidus sp.]MCA3206343.1 beta-glucosidase BglX [Cupriavidus sp.]